LTVLCAMIKQEREKIAAQAVRDLVKIYKDAGEPVPPQLRHAYSAVNGNTTIKGKPECVGLDRALSLIEKSTHGDDFKITIEISLKK